MHASGWDGMGFAFLLVEGYAELAYNPRNNLLEVCAEGLQQTYLEASSMGFTKE